jgi:hypothetical protein
MGGGNLLKSKLGCTWVLRGGGELWHVFYLFWVLINLI